MRETHVPLESLWERLVSDVKEGSKRPSKSLKGSKLRRTSNLTFSKNGHKLHTKKQWLRLSLRTIEYATKTYRKYFYSFKVNLPMVKRKRKGLNFTECSVNVCRFLQLHRHIENEAATMQSNRSAHTAWMVTIIVDLFVIFQNLGFWNNSNLALQ